MDKLDPQKCQPCYKPFERWDTGIVETPSNDHSATSSFPALAAKFGLTTSTQGEAILGVAKGAGIGLGIGVAAALVSILVPGFGLVSGGGALADALIGAAGALAAGAVVGGVTGYLIDHGVDDVPAKHYTAVYEHGGAILTVVSPSNDVDDKTIKCLLNKYKASSIRAFQCRSTS